MYFVQGLSSGIFSTIPILVFLISAEYLLIGKLGSLFALAVLVVTLIIGKMSDKLNKITLAKAGYLVAVLLWGAALLWKTSESFLIMAVLYGIAVAVGGTAVFAYFCGFSKKRKDIPKYLFLREVGLAMGRVLSIGVIILFGFDASFVLAIILLFSFIFLVKVKG